MYFGIVLSFLFMLGIFFLLIKVYLVKIRLKIKYIAFLDS
jgi:hypothetical protein